MGKGKIAPASQPLDSIGTMEGGKQPTAAGEEPVMQYAEGNCLERAFEKLGRTVATHSAAGELARPSFSTAAAACTFRPRHLRAPRGWYKCPGVYKIVRAARAVIAMTFVVVRASRRVPSS